MIDLQFTFYTLGIALLYLQLHRVSQEASHLQRALDYVKRTMRSLNGRKVTFLCGDAGPLAVGAVVHHKLNNTADSKDCLSRWVSELWVLVWMWYECCSFLCSLQSYPLMPLGFTHLSFNHGICRRTVSLKIHYFLLCKLFIVALLWTQRILITPQLWYIHYCC